MAQHSAIDQMVTFFVVVHDPRRQHLTMLHPLEPIFTITILATSCGAQNQVRQLVRDQPDATSEAWCTRTAAMTGVGASVPTLCQLVQR